MYLHRTFGNGYSLGPAPTNDTILWFRKIVFCLSFFLIQQTVEDLMERTRVIMTNRIPSEVATVLHYINGGVVFVPSSI